MTTKIATREAYGRALVKLGEKYANIVVLDGDLSKSTKTADFAKVFPHRFINVGIAEQNLMGTAAGLATTGKIPFVSTFAMFATGRAFEQIRNTIAYPRLNVKIAATHAGITVGEDGASHQTVEDISLMRSIPHMTVIVPADAAETEAAVLAAAQAEGPVYIRLGRLAVPAVNDENYRFEWGKAVVLREGTDVALIGTGLMVDACVQAAKVLETEGISAAVLNVHTIKPIDRETIVRVVKTTGAVVTAEEHSIIGGLGSAVAEVLGENRPAPLKRVGVLDSFGESGAPQDLLIKYGLTAENIVNGAREVIKRK
ncbi:transketolase family protein [Candidatus Formimonas warabiya]|uniref:Transketolase n=1 Tax=Formimonas warabiya TaxID=1761012 RepID=A0A3G1KTY2_FORW1|nr:transketolase family protein [Candidatus Formimonas warabiya]ATW25928.1 transketolase [Candidatus Formimonas warabiya]